MSFDDESVYRNTIGVCKGFYVIALVISNSIRYIQAMWTMLLIDKHQSLKSLFSFFIHMINPKQTLKSGNLSPNSFSSKYPVYILYHFKITYTVTGLIHVTTHHFNFDVFSTFRSGKTLFRRTLDWPS